MASVGPPPGSSAGHSEMRSSQRSGSTSTTTNFPRQRAPRTLPAWIASYEAQEEDEEKYLLTPPSRPVAPQHNSTPGELHRRHSKDGYIWAEPALEPGSQRRAKIPAFLKHGRRDEGRKWDHLRSAEPVIVARYTAKSNQHNTWGEFFRSSQRPRSPNEVSEVVDIETLNKLQPNFNQTIDIPPHSLDRTKTQQRRVFAKRIWKTTVRHPLVPLAFRLAVMLTSIISLAVASKIALIAGVDSDVQPPDDDLVDQGSSKAQAIMAIIVDCCAIPYIAWMLWDEYTGKPLGLRPAASKIWLILLDLFFIVFKSASTALTFEILIHHHDSDGSIDLNRALASFMVLGLMAWITTFIINIFRAVERLGGGENQGGGSSV